ncbi:RNA polymerase sigma factor [Arthrobacter sp. CJ23]|uniref:RNA polymerase sigma factor n=1 Tax=Arthrobacter sp. CJ23 TaxID=2972479 RepID=UPI00215BD177|nr:sigma-70 family RNA polymerase sigma factor [Arthrobacter sp. CJ23]UVJ41004.1 sigma-70 family RNA polymerase sigma factor [Arthrobacter sp. CJ23]
MLAADEHEFLALHTQHFTRVYRYIAYRIQDQSRAEELAADVFRIAWQKRSADAPGIGWLIATARNVLGNEYKGRRRQQQLRERLESEARLRQDSDAGSTVRQEVAEVLTQLSERHREVLMLSYWDDLTTAELAESLGCSVSAAGVRLHRARQAFARISPAHLMTERKG